MGYGLLWFVAAAGLALAAGSSWFGRSRTFDVRATSFDFTPATLTIRAGDAVRWSVVEGRHSSTATSGIWDSESMEPGDAFTWVFDRPGRYPYLCTPHDFMTAELVVRARPAWMGFGPVAGTVLAGAAALSAIVVGRRDGFGDRGGEDSAATLGGET